MAQKIPRLNDILSDCNTVLFIFPPIAFPLTSDNTICSIDSAVKNAYTTFVWSQDTRSFALFEFSEDLLSGLMAYRYRHGSISDIEIILSRDSSGNIRMTAGQKTTKDVIPKSEYEKYKKFHERLADKYLGRLGQRIEF